MPTNYERNELIKAAFACRLQMTSIPPVVTASELVVLVVLAQASLAPPCPSTC